MVLPKILVLTLKRLNLAARSGRQLELAAQQSAELTVICAAVKREAAREADGQRAGLEAEVPSIVFVPESPHVIRVITPRPP